MKLIYTLVAPLWTLDTATLERRQDIVDCLLLMPGQTYAWGGRRCTKDINKMQAFVDLVKHELRNRWDRDYRNFVSMMLAGQGDDTTILVMADRLEELAQPGDFEKSQLYRQWVNTKNGKKVST